MLNLIEIKKAIVEVQRFIDRADCALGGVNHIDHDYHVYTLKRTSIDAENALKALRKVLVTAAEPVPVPTPEVTDVTADVV